MLTRSAITALLDLVENKLSCMEVTDIDDRRSSRELARCREELKGLLFQANAKPVRLACSGPALEVSGMQ